MMGMVLNNFKNDFGVNVKKIRDMKTFNTVWFMVYFLCIAPMIFFRHSAARAFFPVYYSQAVPIVIISFVNIAFSSNITKTMMLVPMEETDRRKYVKDAFILKCIFSIIPIFIGAGVIVGVYPGIEPQMLIAILPYIAFAVEYNMVPDFSRKRKYQSMTPSVFKVLITAIIMILTAVDLSFVYEPVYIVCVIINTVISAGFVIWYYPGMIRDMSTFEYSYDEKEQAAG